MRFRTALAAALLSGGGFAVSSALALHDRAAACSSSEGLVQGYSPTATHSCSPTITVNKPLFRVETLGTGATGTFTFHTNHLYKCRESSSSGDVLFPTVTAVIKHTKGTTWCYRTKANSDSNTKTWLLNQGQVIPSGTILGVTSNEKGSTVKLAEGTATVVSRFQARKVFVPARSQLFLPASGPPQKPTPLRLTADDTVAVRELQLDVTEMGAAQPLEHLESLGETSVLVIGQDDATARREAARLGSVTTAVLNADQIRQNPKLAADRLKELGAKSIVTVGTFAAIAPIWDILRSKSGIPPATAILYVPAG